MADPSALNVPHQHLADPQLRRSQFWHDCGVPSAGRAVYSRRIGDIGFDSRHVRARNSALGALLCCSELNYRYEHRRCDWRANRKMCDIHSLLVEPIC